VLEEQVEAHKTSGAHHKTTLEAAEKQVSEAKKIHDEAHAAHETHTGSLGLHPLPCDVHVDLGRSSIRPGPAALTPDQPTCPRGGALLEPWAMVNSPGHSDSLRGRQSATA